MQRLGEAVQGPRQIHLVGGASAVLVGWRDTTVDVDLKLAPGPPGVFQAIAAAHPDAHSRYNALIRRLVSFERALEARGRHDRRFACRPRLA